MRGLNSPMCLKCVEFWKKLPANEPFRVVLGNIRNRLHDTMEHMNQLLYAGNSDIAEEDTLTSVDELLEPLVICYRSLCSTGDKIIADGGLLDFMRLVSCFGLSLIRLDIRQEADRHTDVLDAITRHLRVGSYRSWSEVQRQEWLLKELQSKRPLFGSDLPKTNEVQDVLETFRVISKLPADLFGVYIISMATTPSDVLAVELLQNKCQVAWPLHVVPLFERQGDLEAAPGTHVSLFSIEWYRNRINGRQEVMIGYSNSGKDAGHLSAAWQLFKAQEDLMKVAKRFGIKVNIFHGCGGTVAQDGGPAYLAILSQPPDSIQGSLRVTIQGEVIEQSFGDQHLCLRTLQRFTAAALEHRMNPPAAPKLEWRALMDKMAVVSTDEYRSFVFNEPNFMEYFCFATPVLEYGRMNIGSGTSERRPTVGIDSLGAISWIFAWTQTRFHLPVWLGLGVAFKYAIKDPVSLEMLCDMYREWPFFRATIYLLEMALAKGDPQIAALYDTLLVNEELRYISDNFQAKYKETKELLIKLTGHKKILEENPTLRTIGIEGAIYNHFECATSCGIEEDALQGKTGFTDTQGIQKLRG